ncbi:cytochrome P450 2C39-like [Crotalus tigris]|uniref:cytochrome P450 2C39-like n=1 Tax=Crotalus tigris TaxID=88082 RepID=UPI00192F9C34|nr:cytochrome P450 2C39-like [Crotalus tigris]
MAGIWEVLTALLVGFLILDFGKLLWSSRRYPPGPLPFPFIGGLWQTGTKLSIDMFTKLRKKYGDIYTIWLWRKPIVVISGFHAMKESVINHSQDFADRPLSSFLLKMSKGKGVSFSNGHNWRQQRRFTLTALRTLGVGKKDMESKIEQVTHQLVETFAHTKGQPIDPFPLVMSSVCNMVCLLTLGYCFSPEDPKFQMILEDISNYTKFGDSVFLLLNDLFPWLMEHLPGPHQKIQELIKKDLLIIKEEAEKHSQGLAQRQPKDILDLYLLEIEKKHGEPNSTFDNGNMAHSILELFFAGTETTASFLQWALFFMMVYPDIQDKVYKEMETVLGSCDSVCYEDRWKLPYTHAVVQEILRLKYVLLFSIPRQTVTNVNTCGLFIPKGTFILMDVYSVLHDPKQWEKPEEFNPNHFLDKDGNFMKREEFMPFGAGARVCVGETLAKMESFLFFTNLLRTFKLQQPEGAEEPSQEPLIGVILHPRPFKICAVPRSGHPKID